MPVRVAVVDDQELVRHAFAVMLGLAEQIEVVGEAADGRSAVAMVERERPDVVLMDIHMPDMDGIEATRAIAEVPHLADCRVLMLTTFDLDEHVYDALRAGASGFLLKDTSPPDLVRAVEVVAAGDALLDPKITRRMVGRLAAQHVKDSASAAIVDSLTEREAEVLGAVARGLSNQEIGEHLHMGYGTVKTHVGHLLTKLGCRDRSQLVIVAYESGFVTPGAGDTP